ncbi:RTA1-domain-containing protein [Mytilinidion resinicola]|uniref:RTA1-domain-containing protein n=1 Tax=Mytilinidion resinicola TaxID=574789 RepID=A0A6A6XY79_9PEZI|nr:RTA1-domain-containing protein [Mytilinidion resinicola]KAF2801380.1 RTA1-domain-containing protein [Mytilinidion resinicola]
MPEHCTKETCPISDTIYGYAPQLAADTAFLVIFAVSMVIHGIQGYRYKTWTFLIAMTIGNLCEAIGYGGRIMLHSDPFSDSGFKLQICLLTIAPAFFAAGIYLTLKHLVLTFGPAFSRLRPSRYTHTFISCDVVSIILQGVGGILASIASQPGPLMTSGNDTMMAGLSFQVFTLLVFGLLTAEYFTRVRTHRGELNPATEPLRASTRFRCFLVAVLVAYTAVLLRCVYRIAEMSKGWGSTIMRDEDLFLGLDSGMCALATVLLNAFHPGLCFGYSMSKTGEVEKLGSADSERGPVVAGENEEEAA